MRQCPARPASQQTELEGISLCFKEKEYDAVCGVYISGDKCWTAKDTSPSLRRLYHASNDSNFSFGSLDHAVSRLVSQSHTQPELKHVLSDFVMEERTPQQEIATRTALFLLGGQHKALEITDKRQDESVTLSSGQRLTIHASTSPADLSQRSGDMLLHPKHRWASPFLGVLSGTLISDPHRSQIGVKVKIRAT